jgi:mannosyltransferase OCH1-like enzyme
MTRTLHFIWLGSALPMRMQRNIDQWRKLNPGWSYRLWDDQDLDWLVNRAQFDDAPSLVPGDGVRQLQADIARYEILHQFGGFYADCDTVPLKPLDESVLAHSGWAAMEDGNWVGNTYLWAAEPGGMVWRDLIDGIPNSIEAQRGKRANSMTGPKYLTPVWSKYGLPVGAQDLWFPYSYRHVKLGRVPKTFGDAYAVHEWQHTRNVLEARNGKKVH